MGKRGPPPVPTAILKARGSWLAPLRKDTDVVAGTPRIPEWLPAECLPIWDDLSSRLMRAGVITERDGDALALLVYTYRQWVSGEDKVFDRLLKLLVHFGMTPSSRSGVEHNPKDAQSSGKKTKDFIRVG